MRLLLVVAVALVLALPAGASLSTISFFTTPIDTLRAGGEPVMAITSHGTIIVAAHPGWTHTRYPPTTDLAQPATGQSYLWRSTDDGASWQIVSLAPLGIGPRGLGQGTSDPDLSIDANGRVYLTDLESLAAASVSWSDDEGKTWLLGNDIASTFAGAPIDRNWLATHGTDVYLKGNYEIGEHVLKSSDGGVTWTRVGDANCGGDFVARESDGALFEGCGGGAISVSTDGGRSWSYHSTGGSGNGALAMQGPALDRAGNVYVAWATGSGVYVAGSADSGVTWHAPVLVSGSLFPAGSPQTHIWPWVVAGDAGRVAVAWYATNVGGGPDRANGAWNVYEATVLDALGATPTVVATQITASPIITGYVCESGTTCQINTGPSGDRRLGDFFEAAMDTRGMVDVAYSVAAPGDSISHPHFAHQTAGPSLLAGP